MRRGPARIPLAGAVALLAALAPTAACDAGGGVPGGRDGAGPAAGADAPPRATAAQERDTTAADTGRAAGGDGRRLTTIDVAGHEVKVEVADDEAERKRGLMHRDSLPEDQGMLFVYPEQQTLSFWMRNTKIPLDIAYIDRRGYIVDIHQMEPHTEKLHRSSRPAMYALEMSRGWFEAHGVEEGDRVQF